MATLKEYERKVAVVQKGRYCLTEAESGYFFGDDFYIYPSVGTRLEIPGHGKYEIVKFQWEYNHISGFPGSVLVKKID